VRSVAATGVVEHVQQDGKPPQRGDHRRRRASVGWAVNTGCTRSRRPAPRAGHRPGSGGSPHGGFQGLRQRMPDHVAFAQTGCADALRPGWEVEVHGEALAPARPGPAARRRQERRCRRVTCPAPAARHSAALRLRAATRSRRAGAVHIVQEMLAPPRSARRRASCPATGRRAASAPASGSGRLPADHLRFTSPA